MTAKPLPLFLLILAATAAAGAPKAVPAGTYQSLWTHSPFTSPARIVDTVPVADPFANYALAGVSPVAGGYRVTLLDRTQPDERIVLPGNPDFKILSVRYDGTNPLATTVRLSNGAVAGTVSFDSRLLTLKAHAAASPAGQAAADTPSNGGRAPRSRVSPPAPHTSAPGTR